MLSDLSIVDAFTDRAFAGNPAGVCFLETERPDDWMQRVAAEVNLSETAFLLREGDGFRLRWFTPEVEVDLCGHATLASAHALWSEGRWPQTSSIRFMTKSGPLTVERDGNLIELDFPALPIQECESPENLIESLGTLPRFVGGNGMDYLCEVADEATLLDIQPDFPRLRSVRTRGVIVTCRAPDGHYDFLSRFFAPALGVSEDPVCGSAHCALGPYWASKLGKNDLNGYQASQRGGSLRVRVRGDRVRLGGRAVTVIRGKLDA
jgi:PhzF family phenazine biosynthesis protein